MERLARDPSKPLTNAAGVDFTLTAEVSVPGSDQVLTLQEQINVGVANPPPTITRFTATLAGVYTPNATATLTWKVAGSDAECTLTGVSQLLAPNGTIAVLCARASFIPFALEANQRFFEREDVMWLVAILAHRSIASLFD